MNAAARQSRIGSSRTGMPGEQTLAACLLIALSLAFALGDRWFLESTPDQQQCEVLVAKLGELPDEHGPWTLESQRPLTDTALAMLDCVAATERVYVHRASGRVARVTLVVGPAAPTAVHLPQCCYASQNYLCQGRPVRLNLGGRPAEGVSDNSGLGDYLWWQLFKQPDLWGSELQVAYGWSDGGCWSAERYPRVRYLATPLLCKLQICVPCLPGDEATARETLQQLATYLLPDVRCCVLDPLAAVNAAGDEA